MLNSGQLFLYKLRCDVIKNYNLNYKCVRMLDFGIILIIH